MKKILFFSALMASSLIFLGQEAVVSAGDHFSGSSGSISTTIGEIATETYIASDVTLTQGQQQHYYDFTSITELETDYSIRAYPNPVQDVMYIEIDNFNEDRLTLKLFNLEGKILKSEVIANSRHELNLSGMSASNYLITISNQSGQIIQKFQLTKQ